MQATQRRRAMIDLLKERGSLVVRDIAAHFGVSKMTVHRDLELLEERGQIRRIFGGAVAIGDSTAGNGALSTLAGERCMICYRPSAAQLLYILTLHNGERRVACCPHCGIMGHLTQSGQIAVAMTADFLTGHLHSAQHSWFLWESAAAPCCHPSLLTFESEEMARRFQNGFGGQIGRLEDAITFLREETALGGRSSCPHCAEGG